MAMYLIVFAVASLLLAIICYSDPQMNIEAILSAVATTLGNMGPGFGKMGPMFSFAYIPPAGKMDRQAGNRDGTGAAGAGVLEEMIPENASKFLEITMPYAL